VLGLNAIISKRAYEVTAEMVQPGQANFIASDALLTFLHDYGQVALRMAQQLSCSYYVAHEEIRTLGLTASPAHRFAKLLLGWSVEWAETSNDSSQLHMILTHEEIAEMIGTTRETVTRLFADFRKKQFIHSKGSTLVIRNRPALEAMTLGDNCRDQMG
jgi:CRP/FNR family cyclic AMP-dependent transcriptional regulator